MSSAKGERRARGRRGREKDLVGRDFSRRARANADWRRTGAAILVGLVLGGLLLVSLRMAILRTRYSLADALARETVLLDLERAASVELRELKDPRRLRRLAREIGFARAERVIELGTEVVAP